MHPSSVIKVRGRGEQQGPSPPWLSVSLTRQYLEPPGWCLLHVGSLCSHLSYPPQPLLPLHSPFLQDNQPKLWGPKEVWGFPKRGQTLGYLIKWMITLLFSVWAKINNQLPVSVYRLYLSSRPARAHVLLRAIQEMEGCRSWQKRVLLVFAVT